MDESDYSVLMVLLCFLLFIGLLVAVGFLVSAQQVAGKNEGLAAGRLEYINAVCSKSNLEAEHK